MKRRDALLALAGAGSALAVTSQVAWCRDLVGGPVTNVLDHIPGDLHAAIRRGRSTTDLARFFDLAARHAVANGQALYVPQGTYSMRTWSPPADLLLTTDGRSTVFEQLPTNNVPQRFIRVLANNVRLWPGSSATITGNIAANATSFNSGVQVFAEDGATIEQFACGDIYGENLGGDVIETGSHPNGRLGHCSIGTIYGDNIYRNIVSITAGATGHIQGVVQTGGVGMLGVDFEPDPGSGSPIQRWTFDSFRCHRVSFVGDPAVPVGVIEGRRLDLDYRAHGPSSPPFRYGGVTAATEGFLFLAAIRYRNCRQIRINEAVISHFPRGAIIDIGEGRDDGYTDLFRCDYLELHDNGLSTSYEIAQHKTRLLSIGYLVSRNKPTKTTATLIGATATDSVAEIEAGSIDDPVVAHHTGRVRIGRRA